MSMYRSYLLKNDFWAKKGNEKGSASGDKVFIKHDESVGGIWAIIENNVDRKGVKIVVGGQEHFFNNFDKLDAFLNRLQQSQDNFIKILRRKDLSKKLRMLEF